MSWFIKIAREWGQIPFGLSDKIDFDPYSRKNPDYPHKSRKSNMLQDSLGLGSDKHSDNETSGSDYENGKYNTFINSLTSGHDVDSKLYNGVIMDEGPGHTPRPRTTDTGGPSIGDAPSVLGIEDDAYGNYVLRNKPNDTTPKQRILDLLNFQRKKPKRRANVNGNFVNVID